MITCPQRHFLLDHEKKKLPSRPLPSDILALSHLGDPMTCWMDVREAGGVSLQLIKGHQGLMTARDSTFALYDMASAKEISLLQFCPSTLKLGLAGVSGIKVRSRRGIDPSLQRHCPKKQSPLNNCTGTWGKAP